ncbi:MAG: hypothetical protein ABI167_06050 [Nitrosospira sp.]
MKLSIQPFLAFYRIAAQSVVQGCRPFNVGRQQTRFFNLTAFYPFRPSHFNAPAQGLLTIILARRVRKY